MIEITQSKWTFWRRWFIARYYFDEENLRVHVERGWLSRTIDYEELLYFNDVKYIGHW